jgi:nicotinate phosphoribosyltransferase
VASNELTEDLIADLKRQGAPINSWGVGTHLITSSDHPALGGVYKLVAVKSKEGEWKPRIKLSSNPAKMTDPGCKRIVRYSDAEGRYLADIIRLDSEPLESDPCTAPANRGGRSDDFPILFAGRQDASYLRGIRGATRCEQLLQTVMRDGSRVGPRPSLGEIRARARNQVAALPEEIRRLRNPEIYTVGLSPALAEEKIMLAAHIPGVVAPRPSGAPKPGRRE